MINNAKKGEKFECKLSPNTMLPFIGIDKTISSIDEASQERVMSYLTTELDKKRLTNIFLSSHNHQFLNKYSNSIFNLEKETNE